MLELGAWSKYQTTLQRYAQNVSRERRDLAVAALKKVDDVCAALQDLKIGVNAGTRDIVGDAGHVTVPSQRRSLSKPAPLLSAPSTEPSISLPTPPSSPTQLVMPLQTQHGALIAPRPLQTGSIILPHIILCYRYFLTHLHNPFPADHIRELISQHSSTPRATIDHWFAQTRLNTGWDTLLTVLSSPKLSPFQRDQYRERILVHTNNYFVNNQSSGSAQMDSIMAGIRSKAQASYYNDVVLGSASNNMEEAKKRYPTPARSPEPESRSTSRPAPQVKKFAKKRSRSEEIAEDATASAPPAKRLMRRKPLGRPAPVFNVDIATSSTKRTRTDDDEDVPHTTKRARTQMDAVIPSTSPVRAPENPISPPSTDVESKKRRRLSDSHTSFVLPTTNNNNLAAKKLLRSVSTPALERSNTSPAGPSTPPPSALSPLPSPVPYSPPSPKSLEFPNDPRVFEGWFDRASSQLGEDTTYAFARYV